MHALAVLSRFVGNTFAFWVLLAALLAFFTPAVFKPLSVAIVPLLGVIMFGMGLTLRLEDFAAIGRHPWRVLLGVVAHFVIMPGVAWALCKLFHLPPEIAVGVMLGVWSREVMAWVVLEMLWFFMPLIQDEANRSFSLERA